MAPVSTQSTTSPCSDKTNDVPVSGEQTPEVPLDNSHNLEVHVVGKCCVQGINKCICIASPSTCTLSPNGDSPSEVHVHVPNSTTLPCHSIQIPTFKLVSDNIDKTVTPREQVDGSHKESLHYFHMYAVKDRIDLSKMDDKIPTISIDDINVEDVLPTEVDDNSLQDNFTILAARVIREHIPYFRKSLNPVTSHIHHEYYKEMSKKSVVVSQYGVNIIIEWCID